ncbi:MAG: hypothetical protein ACE5JG_13660, partial [Planctomycetota bacterium]
MQAAWLLASLVLHTLDLGREVHQVRVADLDADGREDVVAATREGVLLFRGGPEGIPRLQDDRPLDHVLELPDVPRPGVVHQLVQHALGETRRGPSELLG